MSLPSGADLLSKVSSEGFSLPAGLDADLIVAAAYGWLQQKTGYRPFEAVRSTKKFTPSGSGLKLSLKGHPLVAVHSLTTTGGVLTESTDFFLDTPVCRLIQFKNPVGGSYQSIVIDAEWGYCVDLKASYPDAYWAILAKGCEYAANEAMQYITKGKIEEQLAENSVKYGPDPWMGFRSAMRSEAKELVMGLRNPCVGG